MTFSFVAAISAIGLFIFFMHHMACSIQPLSIFAYVADDTMMAVAGLFSG